MSKRRRLRSRALNASRPLAVWRAEGDIPQTPSGMEKEEKFEYHMQHAMRTGTTILTPKMFDVVNHTFYELCYPTNHRMPKQHIHDQPLCMEQGMTEYDMDSDEKRRLHQQYCVELTELKFELMLDKLEQSSGQTMVSHSNRKLHLDNHDEHAIIGYDKWPNKRPKKQHPTILSVPSESRAGQTGKMQTCKNIKNDEKMLTLHQEQLYANSPRHYLTAPTDTMQQRDKLCTENLRPCKNIKNYESAYCELREELLGVAAFLEFVESSEREKLKLVQSTALTAEKRFAELNVVGAARQTSVAVAGGRRCENAYVAAYSPPYSLAAPNNTKKQRDNLRTEHAQSRKDIKQDQSTYKKLMMLRQELAEVGTILKQWYDPYDIVASENSPPRASTAR